MQKNRFVLRSAAICLFALALTATQSIHAEVLKLSLDDAIRMALHSGAPAQLARSQAERAEVARREARYALLPQGDAKLLRYSESINLETFGFTIPGQPPVVGPFDVYDGQISIAAQIFNLAAIRLYQSRSAGVTAGNYQLQQAENDVVAAVSRLYVLVQRSEAQVASRSADVQLFDQLTRVAQDEFNAGTSTRLDVAQANLQAATARGMLLTAESDRENAALALLNAIGAEGGTTVMLVDPLPTPPPVPAVDDALARAATGRPEIMALEARRREAELAVSAAKAMLVPRLSFDYQGDISGNTTDDLHSTRRIGGTVTVPLFHAQTMANIARARLDAEDVATQAESTRRTVEQEVRSSVMALQNAEARATVAEQASKVAEDALTIARDRRSAGFGSTVEVDRAEDNYRQAHEALIAARADAALALVQYEHATGEIRSHLGAPQ